VHCVILHVSGIYNLSSLVPNLFPRANKKNFKNRVFRTVSDGKLGGPWERGYIFSLWYSIHLRIAGVLQQCLWF